MKKEKIISRQTYEETVDILKNPEPIKVTFVGGAGKVNNSSQDVIKLQVCN